jgi:hypothetical protein
MSDSTSILDLPTDPLGGTNISNNLNINASEINPNMNTTLNREGNTGSLSLDQTTINQIVNGLQQASVAGATQLPSRDIPMNTNNIMQDPNIQPNYIPPPPKTSGHQDYIKNYETNDEILDSYNRNVSRNNSLDDMYNEIQTPLLLALLYFLLQLPFFKKQLYTYFPILFNLDGNYNIYGYLFSSILFGMLFYLLTRFSESFGKF